MESSKPLRACLSPLALAAALCAPGTPALAQAGVPAPPQGRSVYDAPADLSGARNGDLVWAVEISTGVPDARAWKVLYRSTDIHDRVLPVTGIVVAPRAASDNRRLVVSYAHGTTGLARACAPSLVENPAKDADMYFYPTSGDPMDSGIPALGRLIAAGYVVTATDYAGLGAPGFHQYLVGPTAARNTLDAVAGRQAVVFGWSEGGQAAVWAEQIADYAKPYAEILGVLGIAPVNAAEQLRIQDRIVAAGGKLRSMTGMETLMAQYASAMTFPDLALSDVFTPYGVEFMTQASRVQCSKHMDQSIGFTEESRGPIARKDRQNQEAWMKRTAEVALGRIRSRVPVAVYQGATDPTIYPEATSAFVAEACALGSQVAYKLFPGIDHVGLVTASQDDLVAWVGDRHAGKAVPCAKPPKAKKA